MRTTIYITTVLIISVFYSCSEAKKELNKKTQIIFESGFIHNPLQEKLFYFTYDRSFEKSFRMHNYYLDSIFYIEDSIFVKEDELKGYDYKIAYYQSLKKDTLYSASFKNDTIEKYKSNYIFVDTFRIDILNYSLNIFKYEIPNPPCDGDLTLFFNEYIGLIEYYNRGWGGRHTIFKHSEFKSEVSIVNRKIIRNREFYYKTILPTDFVELENE